MRLKKIFYILIATLVFLPNKLSLAQGYDFDESSGLNKTGESGGFTNTLFKNSDSINTAISQVITTILSFLGVIFLILIIKAGIQWMTAGSDVSGEKETKKINNAKETIKNSIIGLIIVLAAYAITVLVTGVLTNQTLTN
ncbi:MAG: pilin [Parcubacteria group bacterium]